MHRQEALYLAQMADHRHLDAVLAYQPPPRPRTLLNHSSAHFSLITTLRVAPCCRTYYRHLAWPVFTESCSVGTIRPATALRVCCHLGCLPARPNLCHADLQKPGLIADSKRRLF